MDISEAQLKLNEAVAKWAEYCRTGQVGRKPTDGELIGLKLLRAWEVFEKTAAGLGAEIRKEE